MTVGFVTVQNAPAGAPAKQDGDNARRGQNKKGKESGSFPF